MAREGEMTEMQMLSATMVPEICLVARGPAARALVSQARAVAAGMALAILGGVERALVSLEMAEVEALEREVTVAAVMARAGQEMVEEVAAAPEKTAAVVVVGMAQAALEMVEAAAMALATKLCEVARADPVRAGMSRTSCMCPSCSDCRRGTRTQPRLCS